MEQNLKKSLKIGLIFLVIGLLIGSLIVYAATPSSTFYISSGVYPGAPSFTVWREGSNYFAKDANGQIQFSGTNASQTIINSIQADSNIFIKAGTYTLDSTIVKAVDNVVIGGEGKATIIKVADSTSINAFNITDVSGWTIRNLAIDGNKANQAYAGSLDLQNGIFLGNTAGTSVIADVLLEELYIFDTQASGIYARSSNIEGLIIINNFIQNSETCGITVRLAKNSVISNNVLINNALTGYPTHSIYVYGGFHVITGNVIQGGNGDGIEAYDLENGTIANNLINEVGRIGIYITSNWDIPTNIIVDGNIVINAGHNASETWKDGIRIITSNNIVSNNVVSGSGANGIYVASFGEYTVVSGNIVANSTTNGIIIFQSRHTTVTGNTVQFNAGSGIGINQANYTVVSSNTVTDNAYGIYLTDAYYNVISSNNVYNSAGGETQEYGIAEWGATNDYNNILGNNCFGASEANIIIYGTNTEVHLSYNGTTWIS